MNIEFQDIGNVTVVRLLEKNLDAEVAVKFKEEVVSQIETNNMRIILNFSNVTFIDSSGLGAIVTCLKRMDPKGNIFLSGLHERVRPLFELTRMDKVFRIFGTEDEAIQAFS